MSKQSKSLKRVHAKIWNTEWPNVFWWVCARIWWLHNELIPNPRKLQWWLAACNYSCSVSDTGASLSINNKCNKTMQVRRSSNCLQSVLQGNQSTPFAHLQSCKLQVKAHWWNHGRIQQEMPHDEVFISISKIIPRFNQNFSMLLSKSPKNFKFYRYFFIRFWKLRKIQPAVTYWLIATAYVLQVVPEKLQWKEELHRFKTWCFTLKQLT